MKVRILKTTDGKYEGEFVEREEAFQEGEVVQYKGTAFPLERVIQNGPYITLHSSNYVVVLEVIG